MDDLALHPSLQPLKPFWDSGQLAIVDAAGSPDPIALPLRCAGLHGIGNAGKDERRRLAESRAAAGRPGTSPLRAIAIGAQLPRTLRGSQAAVAVNNLDQFQVRNQDAASILESMYATTRGRDADGVRARRPSRRSR